MRREILHVNTDDFYASALRLRDPALRRGAVVVSGPDPRGMVISASYEARTEGVGRGMTVSTARRLCPRGVFVPPDWDLFRSLSRAVFSVIGRYSPAVEPVSLDEGYVDYTGCGRLFGGALDAGRRIKAEVGRETGLEISLGIASSRLVSHVASREAKRAGMVDVYPGCERYFLSPLPIERFPPVSAGQAEVLRELGISTVGDVLLFDEQLLEFCFGTWGRRLHEGARGIDRASVRASCAAGGEPAAGRVLEPDSVDRRLLESVVYVLSEEVCAKLRAERSLAGEVRLELRYADGVVSHGRARAAAPTSDDSSLFESAEMILERIFERRVRVRSVRLSALSVEPEPAQLELLPDPSRRAAIKARRVHSALDRLRSSMPSGVAPSFGRALAARGKTAPA